MTQSSHACASAPAHDFEDPDKSLTGGGGKMLFYCAVLNRNKLQLEPGKRAALMRKKNRYSFKPVGEVVVDGSVLEGKGNATGRSKRTNQAPSVANKKIYCGKHSRGAFWANHRYVFLV